MLRLWRTFLIALLGAAVLSGCRSSEFGSLVRAVESQPGVRRQYIPMLGLARTGVRMMHPSGVYDFRIALFEHSDAMPSGEVDQTLSRISARGWQPLVRVQERDGGRTTIWARESPRGMHMLVFTRDRGESVIVQLEMDAEQFFRDFASEPRELGARHSSAP